MAIRFEVCRLFSYMSLLQWGFLDLEKKKIINVTKKKGKISLKKREKEKYKDESKN